MTKEQAMAMDPDEIEAALVWVENPRGNAGHYLTPTTFQGVAAERAFIAERLPHFTHNYNLRCVSVGFGIEIGRPQIGKVGYDYCTSFQVVESWTKVCPLTGRTYYWPRKPEEARAALPGKGETV